MKRPGKVCDKTGIDVLECLSCGLVFLSSFDHVSEGFYTDSGMRASSAGASDRGCSVDYWRNMTAWDDDRRLVYLRPLVENRRLLDFGCGHGGFLLRARRLAARAVGVELDREMAAEFKKQGLEVHPRLDAVQGQFDLITMFHVLEHIPDPAALLRETAGRLAEKGRIIVEVPSGADALLTLYQSAPFADFTYWSCHLYLFTASTLAALAAKAGLRVDYVKHIQRYPISNHLYWLAKGRPGGHQKWHFLDSEELHRAYEKQLASVGATDTMIASLRA
ncbi:MAG: class I SAM-dependent methyltransferase [Elusimicrobiota bacterium]